MPIMMLMEWEGITKEQYDQIRQQIDWEGSPPQGSILHTAAFTEGSLLVNDIWESTEDFQAFFDNRLLPVSAEVAPDLGEPAVEMYPLTTLYAASNLPAVATALA